MSMQIVFEQILIIFGYVIVGYVAGKKNLITKEQQRYLSKPVSSLILPFTTAVFGGEARIQTIHGDVICKIKPGTQSGNKIRLRGKGIVSMKDSKVFGDQYAVVEIQVPTTLTPQAARKLREFEAECAKTSGTSNGTHAA